MIRDHRKYEPAPTKAQAADLALTRRTTGLVSFELFGSRSGRPARATWDGHTLRLSAAFHDATLLSLVDFAPPAVLPRSSAHVPPVRAHEPMGVVAELVERLDQVHRLDVVDVGVDGLRHQRWCPSEGSVSPPLPWAQAQASG